MQLLWINLTNFPPTYTREKSSLQLPLIVTTYSIEKVLICSELEVPNIGINWEHNKSGVGGGSMAYVNINVNLEKHLIHL